MESQNSDILDEYIYDYIDDLCETSDKYKVLSTNLKERLTELFDSIDDEDCDEILCDIDEINKYLIKLNNLSNNEFTLIKSNGKKLIEKYLKHKEKIESLKIQNNMLQEELSIVNEQKEQAILKIDEINDEYYKLAQEKNNLEMQMNIQESVETQKTKLNNEMLNEEINSLKDRIDYLTNQINLSEEKMNSLSKRNKEIYSENSQLKKELACNNEILRKANEKNKKINEEKESIRLMNRGLQKTIDDLKNQCKDYQTIISYNEEQIKKIKESIKKQSETQLDKKIGLNDILNSDGEEEKNSNNIVNEDTLQKRRNAVDYTGKEINLNELIFDQSESSDHDEKIEKKNQIKLAFTRVKAVRRFNRLKSLNYNYKKENFEEKNPLRNHRSKKTVVFRDLKINGFNKEPREDIYQLNNERLETIMTERSDFDSSKKLIKVNNLNLNNNNKKVKFANYSENSSEDSSDINDVKKEKENNFEIENDETYLYELLFRFLD